MWYLRSLERAGGIQKQTNTGPLKWSSIVQYSCTSIWDLKFTFSEIPSEINIHFVLDYPKTIQIT